MAVTTDAILKSAIYWQQKDEQNISKFHDIGEIGISLSVSTGSGESQVNQVYYEENTLPSGQSISYDLTDLTRNVLESEINISFSNIKGIVVKNKGIDAADIISVSVTGSNAFTELLNGFSSDFFIYPNSAHTFFRPVDGWDIDSSNSIIKINDVYGYGISYEIAVIGVE